jgi:hypothetical protein
MMAQTMPEQAPPPCSQVGLVALAFGLCAAPLAWLAQLVVNFGLASYVCYPRYAPRHQVAWSSVWYGLLALQIVAILIAVMAGLTSYRNWQRVRAAAEHAGIFTDAASGRFRFVAMCGIWASLGFLAAIVFDLIALFAVPACLG